MVCVLFPSPAGGFFISSVFEYFSSKTLLYVSVPCRGLFYFISTRTEIYKPDTTVSVPCRGLFYFIKIYDIFNNSEVFVSVPCRGLFYFIQTKMIYTCSCLSFRPLSGSFLFHPLSLISRYI